MAPESISRGAMRSLHSKFVTPNEAVQWVVENFEIGGSLERLENEISFERGVFHLYGRSEEDAKLHREHVRPYEQARDKIVSEAKQGVIRLLRSGHFIGVGLKMPIVANSTSGFIAPVFWNVLELDFDRMIATSEDMEYRNVQIIPIDRCTEEEVRAIGRRLNELTRPDFEQSTVESTSTEKPEPDPEKFRRRKPRGRPTCMPEIEAEIRRRGTAGELLTPKTAEFEYLAEWAISHCQDADPPSKAWTQKKLSKVYDELIGRKKGEKKE